MKTSQWWWLLPVLMVVVSTANTGDSHHHYLNSFAVEVDGGLKEAEAVAAQLGFTVDRELPSIGAFVLTHMDVDHRSKRSADQHLSRLSSHPKILYAQQEVELTRVKRSIVHDKQLEMPIREIKDSSIYHRVTQSSVSARDYEDVVIFNDPHYDDMWYLKNRGQSGGEKYLDVNVQVAWQNGFTGDGVVVCILDDGVDHTHPDLAGNYDPKASTDLNDKSDHRKDPMPNMTNPDNKHGTRCAGEIAAIADNKVCGVGVAYNAKIGGVRILDGIVTDSLEGEALSFNRDYIHIYSASWGPTDDGKTMEGPGKFAQKAFLDGVLKGRSGLGSIFVWATGNGGMFGDNCNADGFTSRIETLSVGSVSDRGRQPYYMENCTSTLSVVPTGGQEYEGQEDDEGHTKLKVITTDVDGGCIENFQGTSSAAPLAAGCIANVLQANPDLTWRDVQHIVVNATRIPSADHSWRINGAGYHISHKFGFGLMDCGKMVELAQGWKNVPEQHVCSYQRTNPGIIAYQGEHKDTVYVDGCKDDQSRWIQRLEHVQVRLKVKTRRRGDTEIILVSPTGMRSVLLSPRPLDEFGGNWEFTFMSVHHWGEDPVGTWRLEIHDRPGPQGDTAGMKFVDKEEAMGFVEEWELILFGTAGERYGRAFSAVSRSQGDGLVQKAFVPSEDMVSRIKRDETQRAMQVQVKRATTDKRKTDKKNLNSNDEFSEEQIQQLATRLTDIFKRGQKKQPQILAEEDGLDQLNTVENARRGLGSDQNAESTQHKNSLRLQNSLHSPNSQTSNRFSNAQGSQSSRNSAHKPNILKDNDRRLLQEVLRGLEQLLDSSKKR